MTIIISGNMGTLWDLQGTLARVLAKPSCKRSCKCTCKLAYYAPSTSHNIKKMNLLLRYDEQNSNDAGNHDFFRPSNIVSISNNINNKTIEEFPHLTATVERDRTRHKKRNSGENLVEAEKKVSEKNKNFNSDSPSKLDTEHLKTAYVYKPGAIKRMV
eukprot:jgi/Psemu1/11093/gm1.11093_g